MTDQTTRRGGGTGTGRRNRGLTRHTAWIPADTPGRLAALAKAAGVDPADAYRTALAIGLDWLEQTDGAALRPKNAKPPV